jgi:steroid delta-isomerase-like uncharacterized protein
MTIVEQAFEVMNALDLNKLVALVTPDCDWVDADTVIEGPDQLRPYMQGFYTAFPDFHLAVRHAIESGSRVAAETRFTGTHTGPLRLPSGEVPPTGKSITLEGCDYIEVEAGQIKSWHTYANMAEFMAQLGLLPAPAAEAAEKGVDCISRVVG